MATTASARNLTEKARVTEVFNLYIKHNGDLSKFADSLAKKYSEEDGFTYSHTKIIGYLNVMLNKRSLDKNTKDAIRNIEIKKSKRMITKGKEIYELYLECNGNWDVVSDKREEHPSLTDENTGNMLSIVGMKKYMRMYNETARPKEVFDCYMANNGDFSLFINELVEKYSKEDEEEYTTSKITKYLKQYLANRKLVKDEKEQMENIDLLNKKRIIEIGEIIYYYYLKNDGDFQSTYEELSNDPRMIDIHTHEHLDRNGMFKYMREYNNYARPKEVFDEFVEHKGRYYPFSEEMGIRYAKEDGLVRPYPVSKLKNYVDAYITDQERFTPEEKERYNGTLIEIVKRRYVSGGKFIEGYIHFNGDYNKVMEFFTNRPDDFTFFRDDATGQVLNKPAMYDNVDCYLKKPNNQSRVNRYNIVKKLSLYTPVKDLGIKKYTQFIEKIKNGESLESLKEFCDKYELDKEAVRAIKKVYEIDMEFDKNVLETLDRFIATAFKGQNSTKEKEDKKQVYLENSRLNKLECLKKLLEYYLQSDTRRITQHLMEQFDLSPAKFDSALALANENTSDVQLRSLLDKYYAKVSYIESENQEIVDALFKYLTVGYIINGEYTKFNTFDFYKEFGNVDLAEIKKSCYKYYKTSDAERMAKWIGFVFGGQRIYKTPEELAHAVDFKANGLALNSKEKLQAAMYMESMGWPLSSSVYQDLIYRLLCGQISLDEEYTKEEETKKTK